MAETSEIYQSFHSCAFSNAMRTTSKCTDLQRQKETTLPVLKTHHQIKDELPVVHQLVRVVLVLQKESAGGYLFSNILNFETRRNHKIYVSNDAKTW